MTNRAMFLVIIPYEIRNKKFVKYLQYFIEKRKLIISSTSHISCIVCFARMCVHFLLYFSEKNRIFVFKMLLHAFFLY